MQGLRIQLPVGEAWASVTVGPIVQASLRTKEPGEARIRHSLADGALKRFWHAQRTGSVSHTHDNAFRAVEARHHPLTTASTVIPEEVRPPVTVPSPNRRDSTLLTVTDLFERWATDRADKRAPNTIKRYRGSIRSFEAFARGRDVRALTGDDVYAWAVRRRDMEGISPRAINKNDLVAVSSVFRWAAGRAAGQLVPVNPATGISLDEPRIAPQRERTFRDGEIGAILSAALAVQPDPGNPTLSYAKRWCPWLAAYSGARIGELTHLERRDIRTEAGVTVMDLRVTKTGEPRTVPIHSHLIEQGFRAFVEARGPGPLFFDPTRHGKQTLTPPGELRGHKVGKWVRDNVKLDPNVDPNHGWRHTWKTRALGAGIEERIRDAITGHRVTSVGRRYETPTLKMLANAMDRFPRYRVTTMFANRP